MNNLTPEELIERRIFLIRGQKVMLDRDLAELYGVETKYLNRQVKRNIARFPDEFMFRLNKTEVNELVTNWHRFDNLKHSVFFPYAFTEHGVAMLSSVLKSKRAIKLSIVIINTFVKLRQFLSTHKELTQKLNELERKVVNHDSDIKGLFEMIHKLIQSPRKTKKRIGFDLKGS